MNHIGLFEGIGGFSLAVEWMGWETIAWSEINPFCQKILKQHFPKAIGHGDIKTTDFSIYRGQCDIVTGGFPCQPFSSAGRRKGTEDNRYLWPEMLRAIREISPRWVVGENVRGLTNWDGGLVFDKVQADLEAENYEVLPFLLPACGKGAPHRRERIWFIAHAISDGYELWKSGRSGCSEKKGEREKDKRQWVRDDVRRNGKTRIVADAILLDGNEIQIEERKSIIGQKFVGICQTRGNGGWEFWPTEHPICRGNDGLSSRMAQFKAIGNAVVPQLVYQIFKAIEQTLFQP